MRHVSLLRLLVLVLLAGASRGGEPATALRPTLTLEQALASVERVNINVLLNRENAVQALQVVRLQRSNVLPQITATAQQRRSQGVSIGTVVVAPGRPSNRFDALLNGNFALFDAELLSALRSAKVGVEVAEATYRAVVQSVLADVAQTYFAHLRNLRRLDVLDANIARARALHELARNQLSAGVATQIDVTRAEAQVAQADQARLQQVTDLYQSELLLKTLLDVPAASELRLENFQVRRAAAALFAFSEQQTAFEQRADYLAAQKALEQSRIDVRTATYERLPSLSLTGNYGVASGKFDDEGKQEQWAAGLGVSLPIFDGLRAGADRRIALSRQRSQELRVHNLELQISSELRLALQDAGSRNAQIAVAEKSLSLAQEELRLAQQRYQQGVADNREVVEAQNRLAIADDNFVEAVFQYNLSRVELARTKGEVRAVLAEKGP